MLSTLLNVNGLPIGPRPQEHTSSVSPKLVSSGRVLCIAIPILITNIHLSRPFERWLASDIQDGDSK
jgi:hypothetical protein